MQGYSTEAGIFALSLILPSLYFLIIEKSYLKFFVIILGLTWTFSFPAFALFLLFSAISFCSGRKELVKPLFVTFMTLFCVVFLTKALEENRLEEKYQEADHPCLDIQSYDSICYKTFVEQRGRSWKDRTDAIANYIEYMDQNLNNTQKLFGIGAGNAIYDYGKTIANGFLFRLVDSGIVGLLFYLMSAFILLVYAFMVSLNSKYCMFTYILALTSISLILISIFRHSFDLSYWQMFIYASLFTLSKNQTANSIK